MNSIGVTRVSRERKPVLQVAVLGALSVGVALAMTVFTVPAAESSAAVANVSVSTSVSTADVLPGESLTVTAAVTNDSGAFADDVFVVADLPAGVIVTDPSYGSTTLDVAAGETEIVEFHLSVDPAFNPNLTELVVDVSTSTGATSSVSVTVLQFEAISTHDGLVGAVLN